LIQPTLSKQPIIVENGNLITYNGRPSLKFTNASQTLLYRLDTAVTDLMANGPASAFCIAKDSLFVFLIEQSINNINRYGVGLNSTCYIDLGNYGGARITASGVTVSNLAQYSMLRNGGPTTGDLYFYQNSSLLAHNYNLFAGFTNFGRKAFAIGGGYDWVWSNGYLSEIIFSKTYLETFRSIIEQDQQNYFYI